MKATVSASGRVTIPKAVRTSLGIHGRSVLDFDIDQGRLVGRTASQRDAIDELYGTLRLDGSVDEHIERIRGR